MGLGVARPAKRTAGMAAGEHRTGSNRPGDVAPPGRQPGWLAAAVAQAERAVRATAVEPVDEPLATDDSE
jgi:hypothetical protein